MRAKPHRGRRGMLLLVILGLLAMFGLVAIAFVVLTGQARRNAKIRQRIDEQRDRPQQQLDGALFQILVGSPQDSPGSVVGSHGLLEDMYGNDWVTGTLDGSTATALAGGQLIEFDSPAAMRSRVGCVLTMRDGPAAGCSTRIVGYVPAALSVTNTNRLRIVAFDDVPFGQLTDSTYLVNGVPFGGTGFGFVVGSAGLSAMDSTGQWPLALLPNDPDNRNPWGGANEDYDAADFQNMMLAAQILRDPAGETVFTIPSLHRPALISYWINQDQTATTWEELKTNSPDLAAKISLRPLRHRDYHPEFTGSNPGIFAADWDGFTTGNDYSWDVDNDGDGQTDSIWVDLGLPVRATADGRLYKPLFAILCVDMDGRLNLNAHGCLAQAEEIDADGDGVYDYYDEVDVTLNSLWYAGNSQTANLARGEGYGPADINLWPVVGSRVNYEQLLIGDGTFPPGRYGASRVPGAPGDDPLSRNRWYEYGGDYWAWTAAGTGAYGTPPCPQTTGAIGLDIAGRPLYYGIDNDETVDDPYEMTLSASTPLDAPFTPGELERILRPYDADVSRLPDRLERLAPSLRNFRRQVTTASWHSPSPSFPVSAGFGAPNRHFTEFLRDRGFSIPSNQWDKLFPPEMLAGLKMDINRPIGNGFDDNGNGVVDEPARIDDNGAFDTNFPGEIDVNGTPEQMPQFDLTGTVGGYDFDHTNGVDVNDDGTVDETDRAMARQLYARYLYVLALMTVDTAALDAETGGPDETKRLLAQWAVNVIDFRDRDSIMTRFAYDLDPFDGWDVRLGETEWVVWGCERPELLITESLAFHARRTEDTDQEDPSGETTDADGSDSDQDPDRDFDQKFRPQGSLFIELFNPWTGQQPLSAEFDTAARLGVDLTQLSQQDPANSNKRTPVWRIAIVGPSAQDSLQPDHLEMNKDPDDPRWQAPSGSQWASRPCIERAVYFVPIGASVFTPPIDATYLRENFFPSEMPTATIRPGRYAIIGSGDPEPGSRPPNRTYLGFRADPANPDARLPHDASTRYIEMDEMAVTATSPNVVKNNEDSPSWGRNEIHRPELVRIDSPRRLSVSEPLGGYSLPSGAIYDASSEQYDIPGDEPLDRQFGIWDLVKNDVTTANFRVLHLQRLANPLLPFDAVTNPYRTIDAMSVDLTAFNGVTGKTNANGAGGDGDGPAETIRFHATQRGEKQQAYGVRNNLWLSEPMDTSPPLADPTQLTTEHLFNRKLKHSLGYLNEPFGIPRSAPTAYKGDPEQPFPWFTWNNRPFVSHLELLLVPMTRSSLLLNVALQTNPNRPASFFGVFGMVDPAAGNIDPYTNLNQPFPHLLNFFQSLQTGGANSGLQMHRLLEMLHVPSRFVGTQLQGNPNAFTGVNGFRPPFNWISRYREPGRINLNTIYSEQVWNGLMNGFPDGNLGSSWRWDLFLESRQNNAAATPWKIDPNIPTRFAGVFRSFGGGSLVPPVADLQPTREINATLLREEPGGSGNPLFVNVSVNPYKNTNRNPYFRYQGLQRLGNLTTTRSNVYAIWITVGYFEVSALPGGVDTRHPDGYQLGQELGLDTGEVERHRGFYIIDRSIPVGFQRGEDLNAEKTILLRRFIE